MASDAGSLATDTPSSARAVPAPPASASNPPDETARLLKRQREATPPSPSSLTSQHLASLGSPAKSARLALATGPSPPPLTGAAALEDERRRREAEQGSSPPASSDNPSHKVLASLLAGDAQGMSRPSDAPQPAPTAAMDAATKPAPSLTIPSDASDRFGEGDETSPHSVNSIAGAAVTASPTPMDVDARTDHGASHQVAGEERSQPNSLSYPGSLQASGNMTEPSPRGMSFPIPGQTSPAPSGHKKHKCPYCNTEFTRHHNLKSHLLTHSQEKPYVCTECPLRFRRLHDLKRHGKLHTGEKPHICPKCDRKFARGDALARHSKGAGGCAGRRSSMGSFADGDEMEGNTLGDGDDATMSGLYDHGEDEELRRQSMPTVNTQQVGTSENDFASHARTYPPAARAQNSGLYPPNVSQAQPTSAVSSSVPNSMGGVHTPTTSISSAPLTGGSAGMYSQAGMTESPKPLSPGIPGHESNNTNRQRSPGLSQQAQQQQANRRQSDIQSSHGGQAQSKLPGLSHPSHNAVGSSVGAHGRTPSSNNSDSRNMFAQIDPVAWDWIAQLEHKVNSLTETVNVLNNEVATLRRERAVPDAERAAPPPPA